MILVEFANIVNFLEDLMNVIEALVRDDAQNWKVAMEEDELFEKEQHMDIVKTSNKPQSYWL